MRATRILLQHRQPMIRFLGHRTPPAKLDHTPHAHPAAPTQSLPDSFANYRQSAQQHGPLKTQSSSSSSSSTTAATTQNSQTFPGAIGAHSGKELGPVEPPKGVYFDQSELPARFRRRPWSMMEIEAVESGGASLFG